MFYRKRKEIDRLSMRLHEAVIRGTELQTALERADERERSLEVKCKELRKYHVEDLKTIEDMTKERDHALALAVDSGKMLDEQIQANGEIKRKLKEADSKIKRQKQMLDEARRASECPSDCKNRKNANACRTCTRYPHAKDKYEVAG